MIILSIPLNSPIFQLFVKGKKYFRIPLILQKAGLITRKSTSDGNIGEGAVGSGEDIDIAAMGEK